MGRATISPFFYSQSYTYNGRPGGQAAFTAFIGTPHPTQYLPLLAYLFFGPSNFIQDRDIALTMADTRFPRFFQRLSVAAAGNASASFTFNIPSGITPGIYVGNCFRVARDV